MIKKFEMMHLRNAEHLQFGTDADKLFQANGLEQDQLSPLYVELSHLREDEEKAMAVELGNEKIKEKNKVDRYRDRLHGKLFNFLKAILYDEEDPLFDSAQRVMKVIKSAGNPTRLSENAESAMLTTLGNRLEPYRADLLATGAQTHLDKLMEANRHFMALETECRAIVSLRELLNQPSTSAVRKRFDLVYRKIVNAINVFISLNGEAPYGKLVADLNTLVGKYDALLAQRKGRKPESKQTTD